MVECFTTVSGQKTFLTKEGFCKTVNATERGLRCRAASALRETRQLGGRLRASELVHEFIVVSTVEEFFEQCLFVGLRLEAGRTR